MKLSLLTSDSEDEAPGEPNEAAEAQSEEDLNIEDEKSSQESDE